MVHMSAQFAIFAGVGALATAVQYLILVVLVQLVGLQPAMASSVGFVFGAAVNYALNRRITFRSREPHVVAVPKFAVVASAGLLLNGAVLSALLAEGIFYLIAQVVATGVVLCWNFTLNRLWIYRAGADLR
jgi:putative flippase GtrA